MNAPATDPGAHPRGSLLLADDHGLVRHGLQLLIAEVLPQLRVQLAGSLAETVATLKSAGRFDLVLLDLTLSDVHGLAGLHRLREDFPYVPVVILSAQDDRDTVLAALDGGAMGFISKAASPAELKEALTRVLVEHRIHLPQSVSGGMAAVPALGADGGGGRELAELSALGLTERQIEVLGYVVQGLRNKEIARLLDRSEVVVKKHVTATLQALGAPNRTKLLVLLSQRGYRVPSMRAGTVEGADGGP
ncbi:Response regulator transcription factor [Rubrivivax sp. A210]|uniref:response regulator transcription factor n=1 Tax=Rubrivivax sp. A210 TaxID=2772301 RepID=UPI00191A9B36|nr:response regulator transcription factor [Rubrivivax sp. A210]CAD5373263.1 Response regulator transcription factor [Rubrivivax sp. A210]